MSLALQTYELCSHIRVQPNVQRAGKGTQQHTLMYNNLNETSFKYWPYIFEKSRTLVWEHNFPHCHIHTFDWSTVCHL